MSNLDYIQKNQANNMLRYFSDFNKSKKAFFFSGEYKLPLYDLVKEHKKFKNIGSVKETTEIDKKIKAAINTQDLSAHRLFLNTVLSNDIINSATPPAIDGKLLYYRSQENGFHSSVVIMDNSLMIIKKLSPTQEVVIFDCCPHVSSAKIEGEPQGGSKTLSISEYLNKEIKFTDGVGIFALCKKSILEGKTIYSDVQFFSVE